MEKIIIVWEKEILNRIDVIKNMIASNTVDILIVDPKSPNYEEVIKNAESGSVIILNDTTPDTLKKELEEFNKVLKPKPQKILDENVIIDETPRYNRFLKKWNKHYYQPLKPNSKKRWNKRK